MTQVSLTEKQPIFMELFDAITYFIGRQQLVVRVVVERGVNPADLVKGVGGWRSKTEQVGSWGVEWRFFFHGGGCRLTHLQTKEAINWNGPDPFRFSPYFFAKHLLWRVAQGHDLPHFKHYLDEHDIDSVSNLIQELVSDGIITPDYRLVNHSVQADAA
jgi:hypothetical protein